MPREYATKKRKSSASQPQVPAWVWVFTGAVLGAFVMFLIRLSEVETGGQSPAEIVKKVEEASEKLIPITFYDKLKESTPIEAPAKPRNETTPTKPKMDDIYLVQVASFSSNKDAEQLRVELIMLGLTDAHTKQATIASGDIRHRVMIGPISSRGELERTRKALADNKLDALVLKQKPQA